MMRKTWLVLLLTLMAGVSFAGAGEKPAADVAQRMTIDELKGRLGGVDLVVIDVRAERDWKESDLKIAGALREDPTAPDKWAGKYPVEKTVVLYCAWPSEGTSARVALKLMELGHRKVYTLKGGWKAWDDAGYPAEKK